MSGQPVLIILSASMLRICTPKSHLSCLATQASSLIIIYVWHLLFFLGGSAIIRVRLKMDDGEACMPDRTMHPATFVRHEQPGSRPLPPLNKISEGNSCWKEFRSGSLSSLEVSALTVSSNGSQRAVNIIEKPFLFFSSFSNYLVILGMPQLILIFIVRLRQ